MTNTEQIRCVDLEGPIEDARVAVQILVNLTEPEGGDIPREQVLFLAGHLNRELESIHERWSRLFKLTASN
jgi:hypothetical protein